MQYRYTEASAPLVLSLLQCSILAEGLLMIFTLAWIHATEGKVCAVAKFSLVINLKTPPKLYCIHNGMLPKDTMLNAQDLDKLSNHLKHSAISLLPG